MKKIVFFLKSRIFEILLISILTIISLVGLYIQMQKTKEMGVNVLIELKEALGL